MIVYLAIKTWVGTIAAGQHYYGRLETRVNTKEVELMHRLTARGAAKLNKDSLFGGFSYERGDEYGGFDSEEAVVSAGIAAYKNHFPDSDVLLLGDKHVYEPMKVLAGLDEETREQLNQLYQKCDDLGWWDGGNEKEVRKIRKEWEALLNEYLGRNWR